MGFKDHIKVLPGKMLYVRQLWFLSYENQMKYFVDQKMMDM